MLQETLNYKMSWFPIAPAGHSENQNIPQKVQWSQHGLPSHDAQLKASADLVLLAQKG